MKSKKQSEKAITLITLVVAVSIMIIIASMLIYNAKTGIKMRNLKMMQNDIDLLDNKVDAYYVQYGALPAEIEYNVTPLSFEKDISPNDNDKYYVLDLNAFEGLTLNYGADFKNITAENVAEYTDIYVINEQSHRIYYVRGIEMDGVMYYTNDKDEEISIKIIKKLNISFSETENRTWQKSHSVKIDIDTNDNIIDSKYIWIQSSTPPEESAFQNDFISGDNITKSDETGDNWYLWVLVKTDTLSKIEMVGPFYIDNTPPTITNFTTTADKKGNITVTVEANDDESGISSILYSVDNNNWQTSNVFNVLDSGEYSVHTKVKDNLGNEIINSTNVNVNIMYTITYKWALNNLWSTEIAQNSPLAIQDLDAKIPGEIFTLYRILF